jgi:acyl-coenzyme A synthetase/AMP-(fatty) acid ligase
MYHRYSLYLLIECFNTQATEQELVDLVAKNLPDHCRLRAGVKFLDDIPCSSTGKIVRKKLREMFA